MVNYQEERVKLTNIQLNKSRSAAKNKEGAILRLNQKNFEDEALPLELYVITSKTGEICNAIDNNTSTELSKDQLLKFFHGSVTVL